MTVFSRFTRLPLLCGVMLMTSCAGDNDPLDGLPQAEILETTITGQPNERIPHVVTFQFQGPKGTGWVSWTNQAGVRYRSQAVTSDGDYAITAVGMPLGASQVFVTVEGEDNTLYRSKVIDYETVQDDFPELTVEGDFPYTIATNIHRARDRRAMVMVTDPSGDWVWGFEDTDDKLLRVKDTSEGLVWGKMSWAEEPDGEEDHGWIESLDWDGSNLRRTRAPFFHHDFLELDGGYLFLSRSLGTATINGVTGDMRDDVLLWSQFGNESADNIETKYNIAEDFEHQIACTHASADLMTWENSLDWGHSNSLLRHGDGYLLLVRFLDRVVKLDRQFNSEVIMGPGAPFQLDFDHGHFSQILGDRLLMFNNANHTTQQSSAIAFDLDWDAQRAEVAWELPAGRFVGFIGDIRQMSDGGYVMVSSPQGRMDAYNADREWTGSVTISDNYIISRVVEANLPRTLDP